MDYNEKILYLRSIIDTQLQPLINSNYVLWDMPYHTNVGDILIWQGEKSFLSKLPYKRLDYESSCTTCQFPQLPSSTIILLHGGGNWGDLWRTHQDFRIKIIKRYPNNRIIVFPQSVWYNDKQLLLLDAKIMAEHKNLTICARDNKSYELLKCNFENNILLVPDMAFYIEPGMFVSGIKHKPRLDNLYFFRKDKESRNFTGNTDISTIATRDWITIESPSYMIRFCNMILGLSNRINTDLRYKTIARITDVFANTVFRPIIIKSGIKFIENYNNIYTDRLHAMILSILLHKSVQFYDNSYGKLSSFYYTWLEDLDSVSMIKKIQI